MSIQQTVNQGLAVAAALGTQNPIVQEKLTEKKYKVLGKKADKMSIDFANRGFDENVKPEEYEKLAHILDKQNALIPSEDLVENANYWRESANEARLKRLKSHDEDKQEEALKYVTSQKDALLLQRERIKKMMENE